MDKSTIIYIIAIGLFVLSKVFSKKKQAVEEEPTEGSPFDTIFGNPDSKPTPYKVDPFDEIFESFGKAEPIVETPKAESKPTPRGYYTEEAESEEEVFQAYEEQTIDTPTTFTPVDKVEPIYYNQALISAENEGRYGSKSTPIATFDPEVTDIEVVLEEEEYVHSSYFTDFDLRKAVVYAEVLKPKFQGA